MLPILIPLVRNTDAIHWTVEISHMHEIRFKIIFFFIYCTSSPPFPHCLFITVLFLLALSLFSFCLPLWNNLKPVRGWAVHVSIAARLNDGSKRDPKLPCEEGGERNWVRLLCEVTAQLTLYCCPLISLPLSSPPTYPWASLLILCSDNSATWLSTAFCKLIREGQLSYLTFDTRHMSGLTLALFDAVIFVPLTSQTRLQRLLWLLRDERSTFL